MWWGRSEAAKCSLGGVAAAPNEPPTADLWQQRSVSAGLLPGRRAATTLLAASSVWVSQACQGEDLLDLLNKSIAWRLFWGTWRIFFFAPSHKYYRIVH